MVSEDEMVSWLIGFSEPSEMDRKDFDDIQYTATPEAHYNHYGDRGAVDLFTRMKGVENDRVYRKDRIYEVKSDYAVRQATGANEIIRQFNKHRKYFYEGSDTKEPNEANFELIFIPSETTVKHVLENAELYAAAEQQNFNDHDFWSERIFFRSPGTDDYTPFPVSMGNDRIEVGDFRTPESMMEDSPFEGTVTGDEVLGIVEKVLED